MKLKVFKLGGSKAVILPKVLLELLDVEHDQNLQAEVENHQLIISKDEGDK